MVHVLHHIAWVGAYAPSEVQPVSPEVGLTPERWEFLAWSVLTIIAALSAIAVWLMSGGPES